MIIHLTPEQARVIWPQIAPLLVPAVARSNGRIEMEDVLAGAATGKFAVWIAVEGAELLGVVVACRLIYPRLQALSVMFIAGRHRRRWQAPMMAAIEHFARARGVSMIEGTGRRGWQRVLPGYRAYAVAIEKDLRT